MPVDGVLPYPGQFVGVQFPCPMPGQAQFESQHASQAENPFIQGEEQDGQGQYSAPRREEGGYNGGDKKVCDGGYKPGYKGGYKGKARVGEVEE